MNSINASFSLFLISFILIILSDDVLSTLAWERINLPDSQLPFYFNSNPKMKKKCAKDDLCPYKEFLNNTKCYGYEKECKPSDKLVIGSCPDDSRGWVI